MTTSKVNIKGLEKTLKNIPKVIESTTKREEFLIDIRDFVVTRIKAETRKGKDLSRDMAPQPELAPFTKIIRANINSGRWYIDPPVKRPFFKVNFSNLTMTGQLIDSVVGNMRARLGQIQVTVEGDREKTVLRSRKTGKEIKFRNSSDITTNKGLLLDLASRGRTFLGLDTKGRERIRRMVLDKIRRQLKRSSFVAK